MYGRGGCRENDSNGTRPAGVRTSLLRIASPLFLPLVLVANPRLEQTRDDIVKETPKASIALVTLDLNSLDSVRSAAKDIAALGPIDVLINNAAVMMCPYGTTADGFETQFGTNYVAPWLLTSLLIPALEAAPSPRVVFVSSVGHRASDIRWDDIGFKNGETYHKILSYGQSKTASILNALALAQKHPKITAISLHPGVIQTNLGRHLTKDDMDGMLSAFYEDDGVTLKGGIVLKTIPAGASTTLVAAFDPALKEQNGKYLADCQLTTVKDVESEPAKSLSSVTSVAPYAIDKAAAERLWRLTEDMVGEKF